MQGGEEEVAAVSRGGGGRGQEGGGQCTGWSGEGRRNGFFFTPAVALNPHPILA